MTKIALLIGMSEYESGLAALPGAIQDVEAMQRILRDPRLGGFDQVQTLVNREPLAMQEAVEALFASRLKEDLVLLFFSGHGLKDDQGRLYFATRLTRKNAAGDLVKATAVPASFVQDIMSQSRCKRQVVILDCCFSGAFAEGMRAKADDAVDIQNQLGGEGRAVLTSSAATQYSFESAALNESGQANLSVYTRYIVEGIESGAADIDTDGWVSVDELHEYAQHKVQETAPAMKPKIFAVEEGFKIHLSKASLSDPRLRYRREVEQVVNRGTISAIGHETLNALREILQLSPSDAIAIETGVMQPYRAYQQRLQRYEQAWTRACQQENPLSDRTQRELQHFQEVLGLRNADIAEITNPAILSSTQTKAAIAPTPDSSAELISAVVTQSSTQSSTLTSPPSPSRRSLRWIWLAWVGGVAVLGIAIYTAIPKGLVPTPTPTQSISPAAAAIPFSFAKTLTGHTGAVWSLAISPDGQTLFSGSEDRTVKQWSLATGTVTHTFSGYIDSIRAIALSPSGQTLAIADNLTIHLVNVTTGNPTITLKAHSAPIWSLAFRPVGELLVSGSADNTVKLWNLADAAPQPSGQAPTDSSQTLMGHTDWVYAIALSPDGQTLASGSEDTTLRLWDLNTGNLIRTISTPSTVRTLDFSPDGKTLASGNWDGTVKLWNPQNGALLRTLSGHQDRVVAIAISPDGSTLASGGVDSRILLWDLKTGTLRQTLSGSADWVLSLAFSADGKTLVSGSRDPTIKIWQRNH